LRIAKDIHDDLGSGISKIHFLSQEILDKTPAAESKRNVRSVIEISSSLIENMRDLVWELNTENTTLDNLIARIREYTSDYLENLPLKIVASYPETIPAVALKRMVYRNIFMVVKEALNNIVKHSSAVHVYVDVSITENNLSIRIKDDGVGFNRDKHVTGNGLQNMKSRIQSIGGVLIICGETSAAGIDLGIGLIQITKI
jgi:signal transduction histidine kinase